MTFYFGACAGGVWKTTDGGTYWENVSDGFFETAAVGAIAVAPSDPNVIYAGTGEACIRGNVSHGDGVYRSTDAGRTWSQRGPRATRGTSAACACTRRSRPRLRGGARPRLGAEPGARRLPLEGRRPAPGSTCCSRASAPAAVDLSMDPHNPRILYAAIWQAQRTPWSLTSGGPDCGRSGAPTDGGDTWTDVTPEPRPAQGRARHASASPSRPPTAGACLALVEAEDGALFRSDDGGDTWQRCSEEPGLRGRPWYYMHVFADTRDADTVWVRTTRCGSRATAARPSARWPRRTATTTTSGSTPRTRGG